MWYTWKYWQAQICLKPVRWPSVSRLLFTLLHWRWNCLDGGGRPLVKSSAIAIAPEMVPEQIWDAHNIAEHTWCISYYIYAHTKNTFFQKRLLSNQFTGCRLLNLRPGLRLPRQRRQETAVREERWLETYSSRSVCNLEPPQLGSSASQMIFSTLAEASPERYRWTRPPHQQKNLLSKQPKHRPRLISLGTVACFFWHPGGIQIWYLGSRRAFSPLTLAQHLNRKLDTSRGFPVHVQWTGRSCLDALSLSRLMSIPERLKWWRPQPGMSSSTQPFNVQSVSNLQKHQRISC